VDRCEGNYRQPVSGSIDVLSLTEGTIGLPGRKLDKLSITWPGVPGLTDLAIEARVLEPRIYYRMDARIRPEASLFDWSLAEIRASGYEDHPIGLRGVGVVQQASSTKKMLIPLRASAGARTGTAGEPYRLVLFSGDEILEIYSTLTDYVGTGPKQIWRDRKEPKQVWAPEHPIALEIPRSGAAGVYRVVIKAITRSGVSPLTVEFAHD
jgi:hypothetical protein